MNEQVSTDSSLWIRAIGLLYLNHFSEST